MEAVENRDKRDIQGGKDFGPKQPTPYLYNAPTNAPHPGKHQSGVGGPSDRNQDGVYDSTQ